MRLRRVLITACLLGLIFASYSTARPARADDPSFSFTAAGDYGSNDSTDTVLNGIRMAAPNFHIGMGDFSYSSTTPEQAWCDYVRGKVGPDLPFELISGNHEDDPTGDGSIDNFAACLPDKIGNLTGAYAKEYYFDYAGLARFILISPGLELDGEDYDYVPGNEHYDWLSAAIDDAHSSGIKWVIVVNHENCISMGVKGCGIGPDLFNLLVSKKVDLMLQGHDHDYQRSKQLALGTGCSAIVPGSFNPACVANDGSTNTYAKGAGSVLAIVGTGGTGYADIDPTDPEAPYFVTSNGGEDMTYGFLKVDVSADTLAAAFVPTYPSSGYSDSFVITSSGAPTPTPTPTPTQPPSDNQVANPGFEKTGSGWLAPWSLNLRAPAQASVTQDASTQNGGLDSAKVTVTNAASDWYAQLLQGKLPLLANANHTYSFWAKADTRRPIRIAVQQNYAPYATYFQQTLTIDTTWQQYTTSFVPAVSDSNTMLVFNLGQVAGSVWLDDVSLTYPVDPSATPTPTPTPTATATATATATPTPTPPPTPTPTPAPGDTPTPTPTSTPTPTPTATATATATPTATPTAQPVNNLIANSSFENAGGSWLGPWEWCTKSGASGSVSQDATVAEDGSSSARADVTTPNSDYFLQLVQRGVSVTGGTQYTIDFFAKGSSARPLTVGMNQSNSPWSKLFARTVTLSTDWHEYSMTFTTPASESNAMLSFNFAAAVGQVWVDAVSLSAQ